MSGEKVKKALYFGYGSGGHFLRTRNGHLSSLNPREDFPGFPWPIRMLDSGLLENGGVPDRPDGRVYSTCGGAPLPEGGRDLWIAFYWWDRSGDKRGASNSGFYVHGFEWAERADAFAFACAAWPDVVKRQAFPLVLVERP